MTPKISASIAANALGSEERLWDGTSPTIASKTLASETVSVPELVIEDARERSLPLGAEDSGNCRAFASQREDNEAVALWSG
jgi:hypothetical protein